jgi:hypothetical protein
MEGDLQDEEDVAKEERETAMEVSVRVVRVAFISQWCPEELKVSPARRSGGAAAITPRDSSMISAAL